MSKRKYRTPKAKPGELKVQWGKLPHEDPELCFAWGDGVAPCDTALLHSVFCGKRASIDLDRIDISNKIGLKYDDGFVEELIKRGYDIATLRFSIQKKAGVDNDY